MPTYTEGADALNCGFTKDGKCTIEVRDTGIGISDKGVWEIFPRFYRKDAPRNRETGGSGLRLSLPYTLVKAHNGNIKASHNIPKGTIFTIRLPKI